MDHNPYAPPRRDLLHATEPSVGATGEPRPWDIGEVISEAWGVFKIHWATLLGALVAMYIVLFGIQFLVTAVMGGGMAATTTPGAPPEMGKVFLSLGVTVFAQQLVQAFLLVGLNRIVLAAVRGESPEFGLLFSGGSRYVVALLSMFLMILAIYAGMILLLVPGIIVALGLINVTWFTADTELGVMETLKASWASMDGHKWKYFVFLFVLGLMNIGGALACGVGMLVSLPVTFLAMAIVYTRVTGRTGSASYAAAAPAY